MALKSRKLKLVKSSRRVPHVDRRASAECRILLAPSGSKQWTVSGWGNVMATFDAGSFKPVEVIMHPVPKGRAPQDGSDTIRYSEAPIAFTGEDRAFIQARLRRTMGGYARPVVIDGSSDSPIPKIVSELLSSSTELVAHSCTIARNLHLQQKAVSPDGLIMTVIGTVANRRCVVIAKMEHQEGMRVEQTTNSDGKRTFKAQHLKDLILGDGTRVFKLGVFVDTEEGVVEGHVVDDQQRYGGVADYFIHFLGCIFQQQADVQTETFLNAAQKFFTQRTEEDPEKNATYEIALLAEMQSSSGTINPENFALNHLDEDDQDLFLQRLRDNGIPTKSFSKDTALVKSKIRRMRISTNRGADIYAPPSMYEDGSVSVSNADNEESVITVRDKVGKISGASGKRES